jgi:hypothetical protein
MDKDEFIEYLVTNIRLALVKHIPNSMNKEYELTEPEMIAAGKTIIDEMFTHIKDGITLSYIIHERSKK